MSQPPLATLRRAFSSSSSRSSRSSVNSNRSSNSSSNRGGTEPATSSSSNVDAPNDERTTESLQGRPVVHDGKAKNKLHTSVGEVAEEGVQQGKDSDGEAAAAGAGAGGVVGSGELPLDPAGRPREKQRIDVEFGTFHEFTAVNKNGG